MRICFTLDDVLRAKTAAMVNCYCKAVKPGTDPSEFKVTNPEIKKNFKFPTRDGYEKFLYHDYALDIFGDCDTCSPMLDKSLNLWELDITEGRDDTEGAEVMIANPDEFNTSIGFTLFFIYRMATRARRLLFPKDRKEIWDECDILVTADAKLLDTKPEDKVSVKIETEYNKECKADYAYPSLIAFIRDKENFAKVIEKKIKENK